LVWWTICWSSVSIIFFFWLIRINSKLNSILFSIGFDNLYVSDWINDRVLKFPPNTNPSTNGVIVAGTGAASSSLSQLNTPWNIYVDEFDNDALYIADYANHRIVKWYPNATTGIVVAGGNGAGSSYN